MMTQTPTKPSSVFEQAIRASLAEHQLDHTTPAWLHNAKQVALQRFEQMGLPTRRLEAWRFVDLSPLLNFHFHPYGKASSPVVSSDELASFLFPEAEGSRLIFINGDYQAQLSDTSALPTGTIVTTLADALTAHPALLETYLARDNAVENDSFAALNTVLFDTGAFVYLPEKTRLDTTIHVLWLTTSNPQGPASVSPRLLVVADTEAQGTVVLTLAGQGNDSQPRLNNGVVELFVNPQAHLRFAQIQAESRNSFQFITTRAHLEAASELCYTTVATGGRLSRNNLEIRLLGEKAHCELYGLSVLNDSVHVHDHTVVDHQQPHCTSNQLYKGILDGASRSEFDGTIVIRPGAAQTDAAQLNQNLLLSDDAKVFTRPQLRIDNDDVKCSHGATVGQLEEEQLFYLTSRGLSKETAKSVLTLGFAEDIIDKLTVPHLRQQLLHQVFHNLNAELTTHFNPEALIPWHS